MVFDVGAHGRTEQIGCRAIEFAWLLRIEQPLHGAANDLAERFGRHGLQAV
ncbi:hypothetical protein [Nocardia jiangxiensis]|uniref:Uncharacterized protein n=1 Tax=Nocardia jiangxiensis TaxID=282685 RepID=A0ABW6SD68_9NOCA|nr:hypothetical protein [Nocardia jiangxiensis]